MDLSIENRRRITTPSGRLTDLVPSPPSPSLDMGISGRQITGPTVPNQPGGVAVQRFPMLRLESPYVQPMGNVSLPWNYFLNEIWKGAQPSGVTPGTFLGFTINGNGQITSVSPNPTATTPPLIDNSNAVATTAFVRGQGFATESSVSSFVASQGFVTSTNLASTLTAYATEAWVQSQGYITDAPSDGNAYARRNGAWVVVTVP